MARRDLRLWPDPVLTQVCAPADVHALETTGLITDLFDTMYGAQGRGLAAPQIGVLSRVFVVDVSWKEGQADPRVFINPRVVQQGPEQTQMQEQCLSIPDTPMPVNRADRIQLAWTSPDDEPHEAWFDGILARCILHELDHLNGTVIFDHQTPSDRAKLEAHYGT